jgi:membrane protease YdiL (CAAX protease family)
MFTDSEGRLKPAWAFLLSVLIVCASFLACGYLATVLGGNHVLRFEVIFRTGLAVLLLAAFSWLLTVGNHVESHRLAAQGLPISSGWTSQFLTGCAFGAVLIAIAVCAVALVGKVTFRGTWGTHSFYRLVLIVLVLMTGSLAEELMFRGYPFQRLVEAIGPAGAISVFSLLFGLVHILNPGSSLWGLVNTVVIGVVLAVAYLRTRALWFPWGIHFAWNATLGLLLGLPVSGIRLFNVFLRADATGPRWITGGTYGIEASLPGAVVVLLGLAAVCVFPLQRMENCAATFTADAPGDPAPPEIPYTPQPPSDLGL